MLQLQALHTAITLIYTLVPEKWLQDIIRVMVILAKNKTNEAAQTLGHRQRKNTPGRSDNYYSS